MKLTYQIYLQKRKIILKNLNFYNLRSRFGASVIKQINLLMTINITLLPFYEILFHVSP